MLFIDVHAMWTQSLHAGMSATAAAGFTPAANGASPAKAYSRAIPTPRIPPQT